MPLLVVRTYVIRQTASPAFHAAQSLPSCPRAAFFEHVHRTKLVDVSKTRQ